MVEESLRLATDNVLQRAEDYKSTMDQVLKAYHEKLRETEQELKEIIIQLDKQQALNTEAVGMITKVNEEIKRLESENINLEESLGVLKEQLWMTKVKLEDVEESKDKLEKELEIEKESNKTLEETFRQAFIKMNEIEKVTNKINSLEKQDCKKYSCKEFEIYKGKVDEYKNKLITRDLNIINQSFSERCEQYEDLFMKYNVLERQNEDNQGIYSIKMDEMLEYDEIVKNETKKILKNVTFLTMSDDEEI